MTATIGDPPRPTASRFVVVIVRRIRLAIGADIDRTLEFTLNDVFGGAGQPELAVLMFKLTNSSVVELAVELGGYSSTRRYSPGSEQTVHEVVETGVSRGVNRLTLVVREGSCTISNVVVWYQVRT